jgi:hypothetical protein
MAQSSVELLIQEIQRRISIIQSESQTMARELMIDNLSIDLEKYVEMHKAECINFAETMPKEQGINKEGNQYIKYNADKYYNELYKK